MKDGPYCEAYMNFYNLCKVDPVVKPRGDSLNNDDE